MRQTLDDLNLSPEVYKVFRTVDERIPKLHEIGDNLMSEKLNGTSTISGLGMATSESEVERKMEKAIRVMGKYLDLQKKKLLREGFEEEDLERQFDLGREYISHVMVPERHRVNLGGSRKLSDLGLDAEVYALFDRADVEVSSIYINPDLVYQQKSDEWISIFYRLAKALDDLDRPGECEVELEAQLERGLEFFKGRVDYFAKDIERTLGH